MATPTRQNFPNNQISISSVKSTLKVYSVPLLLFALSIFFQLIVVPRNFPTSHYDVLGIRKYSSIEEVNQAYEKITSKWDSNVEILPSVDLIEVRYAFELLTNKLLKRDYDIFNIDEHFHMIEKVKAQHTGARIYDIDLPLIKAAASDLEDVFSVINSQNFSSMFEDDKALLVQIISYGSNRCAQFSAYWKRIVNLLDGVTNTGVVELGDVQLAVYLAEKKSSAQPFFRNGLPALVSFPPGCKSSSCLQRYNGELSVDAITDWLATSILNLPRILYYSKESMVHNFLAKSKPHKVRVIFFSTTGERATPFIRQAAKDYWAYATFAFALWKEEDSSFWWNIFGVESAPAVVFLRDPGVKPVVYQGPINSSMFIDLMENNKLHVLPQLRNVTSVELGCSSRGYSRAGSDTKIWYCAIVAGRQSQELNKMRETMRSIQEKLSNDGELDAVDLEPISAPAVSALKQKRLTLAWLDGEAQKSYCFFHIHSETSYETCGPRRGMTDAAQLFIVRYERNATEEPKKDMKPMKTPFQAWHNVDADPASTLVAKYNGSSEISEIIRWMSKTIEDGDSRELPPFKTKVPELSPEEADYFWSQPSEKFLSSGKSIRHWTSGLYLQISDWLSDPRIGPSLLLAAMISFSFIWLKLNRSQSTQPSNRDESSQSRVKDENRPKRRNRRKNDSNKLIPPSITDEEPKDAQQMRFSDSDSE
ncbi:dnaJ homolog subfamily C member 16 [Olea europaea subsp. europaea]|uniref:DnaJ homolog subfamily C member 16 n=1 Tax=Olea europaea subsp. europaea TaxID=158383 RepID=A0A8S0Q7N6_OLEEU|nr:dnaJ homolog subfamily C member 16 [Olea europaea subsp. europaea]